MPRHFFILKMLLVLSEVQTVEVCERREGSRAGDSGRFSTDTPSWFTPLFWITRGCVWFTGFEHEEVDVEAGAEQTVGKTLAAETGEIGAAIAGRTEGTVVNMKQSAWASWLSESSRSIIVLRHSCEYQVESLLRGRQNAAPWVQQHCRCADDAFQETSGSSYQVNDLFSSSESRALKSS